MTARTAQLAPGVSQPGWLWLQAASEMAALTSSIWPATCSGAAAWPSLPRVATRTAAPEAHSVTTARMFALRTMQRWNVADRNHDVAAVVSELLTNALRHALPEATGATGPTDTTDATGATGPTSATGAPGTACTAGAERAVGPCPIRLGLLHAGPSVLCAVADPSTQAPVLRQPDWLDETGRGLQLVASLSDAWGYCAAPGQPGKVVWATFATSARPD